MQSTVTVSGSVTDGVNHPLAGALVEFLDITLIPRASASTGADGQYSAAVAPGIYDIRVTPPAGSGFMPASLVAQTITTDLTINFALVAPTMSVLTGRVLDGNGVPIAGANVNLSPQTPGLPWLGTTTDDGGNYRFEAARGAYRLQMSATMPWLEAYRPQHATMEISSFLLDADRTFDFRLPVYRVDIHVQTSAGVPAAGVGLGASTMADCSVVIDGMNACVTSFYDYYSGPPMPGMPDYPKPVTDAAGNFTMWLTRSAGMDPPMPGFGGYTITAFPPLSLGLPSLTLQNVSVTGDRTLTMTLQAAFALSGRVLDGAGIPIADTPVSLYPIVPGPTVLSTVTDAEGRYHFGTPPGAYRLSVTTSSPWLEAYRPQHATFEVQPVTIDSDRVLDVLLPVHRVIVRVQRSDGTPVAGVGLSASGLPNCSSDAGGLTTCTSSSYWFYSGPPMPGIPDYPQPITDGDGRFTMWLTPAIPLDPPMPGFGGYTITATPPAGSGMPTTAVQNVMVTGDTLVTITLQGAIALHGRAVDGGGAPFAGTTISLWPATPGLPSLSTQTDALGNYSFSAAPGTYTIGLSVYSPLLEPYRPQYASYSLFPIVLSADRVLDLTLPVHRVDVHVQDVGGRPVAGIGLSASAMSTCRTLADGLTACASSSYYFYAGPPLPGVIDRQPVSDADGNFTMWLVTSVNPMDPPMPGMGGYTLMATPPADSPFRQFALNDVSVNGPTQIVIALQFAHDPPVTTALLSPAPGANGEYPDPVTVALSASAAAGYSIAKLEYQIDGGAIGTYAGPFAVAGGGPHEVRFWATDNGGVYELPQTAWFTIRSIPTLDAISAALSDFCTAGAIVGRGACNSLGAKLRAAAGAQGRGDDAAMRGELGALLNELEAQRGKQVSESAYERLSADIARLLN